MMSQSVTFKEERVKYLGPAAVNSIVELWTPPGGYIELSAVQLRG